MDQVNVLIGQNLTIIIMMLLLLVFVLLGFLVNLKKQLNNL